MDYTKKEIEAQNAISNALAADLITEQEAEELTEILHDYSPEKALDVLYAICNPDDDDYRRPTTEEDARKDLEDSQRAA